MAEFTAAEYKAYVQKYPDLVAAKPAGMSDAAWGKKHWEAHGEKNASRSTPGVAAGNDEDLSNKPDASGYTPREYQDYVQKYPDLVAAKPAGMTDAEWGKKHWVEHGSKNPSRLTPTRAKTSDWWERTHQGPGTESGVQLEGLTKYSDDQYMNYVLANPDLRELSEALGLTQAETINMGKQHWGVFGTDVGGTGENRAIGILNALDHIKDNKDFSAGSQDASEAYIQRITQNAPGSTMWDARTNISPDWRLNQFTGAGWNMAADQPYQTGILGDTLEVNPDIGQLVPTTAAGNVGDLRFVQDRYVDDAIANDFPEGWTTPQNTWADAAPGQLGAYWDVLTNAYRTPEGILRRDVDYDPATAVGPSVRPGPRGGGNIRTDPGRYIGGPATGGPPNPTVPSFGYPGYQDWTRFMPTNFQLAEGGGMHYQPWATGTPQGGGPYTVYSSCFVDGVQVELVDGSEKNVSEISVGDEVKTDKGDGVVTKIYPSKAGGQKLYGFNDKEPFVTEAHPFMTQDGWKKISEVTEGDTLYRNGKGIVTVESITSKDIPEDTPVYNFHVDGHETYFADGYLVHNKSYAPGTGPGIIGTDPNIWGGGGTTTTNTGVIPGSDKANDLANGRTHHPEMYDHNDMWIGSEGGGAREAASQQYGSAGTPWQDSFLEPLGTRLGWNPVYEGVTNPIAPGFTTTTAPGYDYTMDISAGDDDAEDRGFDPQGGETGSSGMGDWT